MSGEKTNKITTIAIFRSDLKELDSLMDRNERYRDKIHELILKEKKIQKGED